MMSGAILSGRTCWYVAKEGNVIKTDFVSKSLQRCKICFTFVRCTFYVEVEKV